MLDSRKRLQEINQKAGGKRTTIILDREERKFIDLLIKEGKEQGLKPLISKLLQIYKDLMIYEWKYPGEYYLGISRVALINVELVDLVKQQVPKEKWHDIGKSMGTALKVSIETALGIDASKQENWDGVFERLKIQGFGEYHIKDKYLLIKSPFIGDVEISQGLMEGLLSIELDIRNSVPPLVFEIKTQQNPRLAAPA